MNRKEAKPIIKLDKNCNFEYKGYSFELTPCTMLTSKQEVLDTAALFIQGGVKGIFTEMKTDIQRKNTLKIILVKRLTKIPLLQSFILFLVHGLMVRSLIVILVI